MGLDQAEIHGSTNFNTSKLVVGVSCAHKCIIVGSGCNVQNPIGKYDQPTVYACRLFNKAEQNYTITKEKP